DVVVATAWSSAGIAAAAPRRCGAGFYFVQHYESLYHGAAALVDATYRLPLRPIVISTWLRDLVRDKFQCDAEVLVTPVDPALFRPVPVAVGTSRPRVLMLHHEYAWEGVAEGGAAARRVPRLRARGRDGAGRAPARRRRPRGEARAARERSRAPRQDRGRRPAARHDCFPLGPRRGPAGGALRGRAALRGARARALYA